MPILCKLFRATNQGSAKNAPLGINLKALVALRSANVEENGDPICYMLLVLRIATQTHEMHVLGFTAHSETK